MSPAEEDDVIRREFKRRGRRTLTGLLLDDQRRLTRPSGWRPRLQQIVWAAERLGLLRGR